MTTIADTSARIQVNAIPANVLRELRVRDDGGQPPRLLTDRDGGSPLRCCLRRIRPGERVALVTYAPLRRWARATGADPGPTTSRARSSSTPTRATARPPPDSRPSTPAAAGSCAGADVVASLVTEVSAVPCS
jgi:hypothetical protein